jgi:hypothetical protein
VETYPLTAYDKILEFMVGFPLDMLAVPGDLSQELHTLAVVLNEILEAWGFY